eukprot:XP_019923238.1 PREDICTED: transient receptor potential cation channel subfamily M member 1-like [Crassostrea gigas]
MVMSVFILGLLPFVLRFDRSDKRKAKENTCMTKIGNRIYNFYTAPIMRFSHTMTSYIVFLGFFSYALLTGFGNEVTWVEILMYVWVFCLMLDEVRELIYAMADLKKRLGPNFFSERPYAVQVYFLDKWNYFDITTLCFFTIGVILDLLGYYETVEVGRVFLAISLIAFFMRILKAFSALEELGPKVWMIASMAKDLLYFVVILMLFVVSYAVAAYAIMYPQSELSVDLFFNVLRLGYWNLYGELLLDDIEAEEPDCTFDAAVYNSGTLPRCAEKHRRVIGLVLMGIYLIFANVMLLNILIAMFTDTYQRIQTKRDHKWNYERYALVREFKRVPIFPMPLGILLLFFNFVKGIYKTCRKCNTVENYDKELLVSLKSSDMMFSLEREMVYLYMKKRSEDTAYSALTEERIAKIVAMQVEKKLQRFMRTKYVKLYDCFTEQKLIRKTGKQVCIYLDKQTDMSPQDLQNTWIVPYEDDDVLLKVLLKHTFISKDEKKIALISTTDKNLAEKLRNELRKIYKHHQIYSTVGLDKNKKYALIANCEIFIACLSDIYYKDNTCRKDIEFANALWKRILPLDIKEGRPHRRPEWLIKIVGSHCYPSDLQDYFKELLAAQVIDRNEEEWIRKSIQVPCQPSTGTSVPPNDQAIAMTMTDAYGKVEVFAEGGLENSIAHYVRLSTTTPLNIVSSLLMRHWGLKRPQLLISITGEGSQILNDPVKARFFTLAFENIVKESGVWITTNGATSEISKVIGQVVEKEDLNKRPTVIGIASWEDLKMNRALELKNGFGRWPTQYNPRKAAAASGDYCLNPICTHFLLPVKPIERKKEKRKKDATANFRANLEEYIRRGRFRNNKLEDDMSVTVPSVLLVVGGDQYQSVSMIQRSLDAKRYVIVFKVS